MSKRHRFPQIVGLACGLLLAVAGTSSRADSLLLQLSTSINGAPPVESQPPPWVTLDFTSSAAGTVTLTITNNLQTAEYLPVVLFNTNPSTVNLANLTITQSGGTAGAPTSILTGEDQYTGGSQIKAGLFDVQIKWGANVFAGTDTAVFTLTDTTDAITAASFDAASTVSSGTGYLAAADVRGIPQTGGGTTSGSIGTQQSIVPEPSSGILALIGLAGASSLAWFRRRKSS